MATSGLVLAGLVIGAPTASAGLLQPVTATATVAGGQAYTSTTTQVSFTITNRSTSNAALAAFSLVVPPGVGKVTPSGVTSSRGVWRESVAACGFVPNCSSLLLVYTTLPLSASVVYSGQSVTSTISFTAPSSPTRLTFKLIGIGGGVFMTSDAPTVTVVPAHPAAFTVSAPSGAQAGTPTTVTVTAVDSSSTAIPYAGGPVLVSLGTADSLANIGSRSFSGGSPVSLTLPPSTTGSYTLPATFFKAVGAQSVTVTEDAATPATGTSPTFAVAPGPATQIVFDSITDDSTPPLPSPAMNKSFHAAFHLLDAYGNVAPSPGLVTLSAPAGFSLSSTPVTAASGTGSIAGTFTAGTIGPVVLTLTADGVPTPATISTTLLAAGASASLTPNIAASLTAGGASSDLVQGANGDVTLTAGACTTSVASCLSGVQVELDGNFKGADGQPLYSDAAPAQVSWTCATACPHQDETRGNYLWNYNCLWSSCMGHGSLFGEREVEEDFNDFPVYVSINKDGADTPFAVAPRCVPLPAWNASPSQRAALLHETGTIVNPVAQTAGFCVDVNAITRADNSYTGALTIPVLFVEDMKMRY
ncbi:MAG TPA: hypothetical protein VIC82_00715 [Candidatus Nanopelagicales bacterium]